MFQKAVAVEFVVVAGDSVVFSIEIVFVAVVVLAVDAVVVVVVVVVVVPYVIYVVVLYVFLVIATCSNYKSCQHLPAPCLENFSRVSH